jgi:chromosome segregation ATPase
MLLLALKNLLQSSILLYSFHSVFPVFGMSLVQPVGNNSFQIKLDTRQKQVENLLKNANSNVDNNERLKEINDLLQEIDPSKLTDSQTLADEIFTKSKGDNDEKKTAQNILELVYSLCSNQRERVEVLHYIIKKAKDENSSNLLTTLNSELKKYFVGDDSTDGTAGESTGGNQDDKQKGKLNDKERNQKFNDIKTKQSQTQLTADSSIQEFMKNYKKTVEDPSIAHENKSLYFYLDFETAATPAANAAGLQADLQAQLKAAQEQLTAQLEPVSQNLQDNGSILSDKERGEFNSKIEALKKKIDELGNPPLQTQEDLEEQKQPIETQIEALSQQVRDAIADAQQALQDQLEAAKQDAQGELNRQLDEVQVLIDELTALNSRHRLVTGWRETHSGLRDRINGLSNAQIPNQEALDKEQQAITQKITALKADINKAIAEAKTDLARAKQAAKGALNEQLQPVRKLIEDPSPLGDKAKGKFNSQIEELRTKINELGNAQLPNQEALEEQQQAIEQQIDALKAKITDAIADAELAQALQAQLEAAQEQLTARLQGVQRLIDELTALNSRHQSLEVCRITHSGLRDRINGLSNAQIPNQRALEEQKQTIEADITALSTEITAAIETAQQALQDQLEAAKQEAKNALTAQLQGVQGLITELDNLNSQHRSLEVCRITHSGLRDRINGLSNAQIPNQRALEEQKQTIEADITALSTEITAAIETAQQALQDQLEAAKQDAQGALNEQLQPVRKLIEDPSPLGDKAKGKFNSQIEELRTKINELGNAQLPNQEALDKEQQAITQKITALKADINKAIAEAKTDLARAKQAAKGALNEQLQPVRKLIEDPSPLGDKAKGKFNSQIEELRTKINELGNAQLPNQEALDKEQQAITQKITALKADINKAIAEAKTDLARAKQAAKGALNEQLQPVRKLIEDPSPLGDKAKGKFNSQIEELRTKINELGNAQLPNQEALDKEQQAITQKITALKADINKAIAEAKTDLARAKQAAKGALNEQLQGVQGLITELDNLNSQHRSLEVCRITHSGLRDRINGLSNAQIPNQRALEEQKQPIETQIEALSQQVRDAIAEAKQALKTQLDQAKTEWRTQLQDFRQNLEHSPLKQEDKGNLTAQIEELEKTINGLGNLTLPTPEALNKQKQTIEDQITALSTEITTAIETAQQALQAQLEAAQDAWRKQLEGFRRNLEQHGSILGDKKTKFEQSIKGLNDRITGLDSDQIQTPEVLNQQQQAIDQKIQALEAKITAAIADAQQALQDQLKAAKDAWRKQLEGFRKNLQDNGSILGDQAKGRFEKQITELRNRINGLDQIPNQTALEEQKQPIEDQITALLTEITAAIAEAKQALKTQLDQAKTEWRTQLEGFRKNLQDNGSILGDQAKGRFEKQITELRNRINGLDQIPNQTALDKEQQDIDQKIQDLKADINKAIEEAKLELRAKLEVTKQDLKGILEDLKTNLTKYNSLLENNNFDTTVNEFLIQIEQLDLAQIDTMQYFEQLTNQMEKIGLDITALSKKIQETIDQAQLTLQPKIIAAQKELHLKLKDVTDLLEMVNATFEAEFKQSVDNQIETLNQEIEALRFPKNKDSIGEKINRLEKEIIDEIVHYMEKEANFNLLIDYFQHHQNKISSSDKFDDINQIFLRSYSSQVSRSNTTLNTINHTLKVMNPAFQTEAFIRKMVNLKIKLWKNFKKMSIDVRQFNTLNQNSPDQNNHTHLTTSVSIETLRTEIQESRTQVDTISVDVANLEQQVTELKTHFEQMKRSRKTLEDRLNALETTYPKSIELGAFKYYIDEIKSHLDKFSKRYQEFHFESGGVNHEQTIDDLLSKLKEVFPVLEPLAVQFIKFDKTEANKSTYDTIKRLFEQINATHFEKNTMKNTLRDIKSKIELLKTLNEIREQEEKNKKECDDLKAECDKIITSINLLNTKLGHETQPLSVEDIESKDLSKTIAFYQKHLHGSQKEFNKLVEDFKQKQLKKLEIEFEKLKDSHYKDLIKELIYNKLKNDIENLKSTDPHFDQKSKSVLKSVKTCLATIEKFQTLEQRKTELNAKLNELSGRDNLTGAIKDVIDRFKTSLNDNTIKTHPVSINAAESSISTHLDDIESKINTLEDELAKQSTESSRAHTTPRTFFSKRGNATSKELNQKAINSLQNAIDSNQRLINKLNTSTDIDIQQAIQKANATILSYEVHNNNNEQVLQLKDQLQIFYQHARDILDNYSTKINDSIEQLKTLQTADPQSGISLHITTYKKSFNWFEKNKSLLNKTQIIEFEKQLLNLFKKIVHHHSSRLEKIETSSIEFFKKVATTQQSFAITKPTSSQGAPTGRYTRHNGELRSINRYSTAPVKLTKRYSAQKKGQFILELNSILSSVQKNQFPIIEVGNNSFKITTHGSCFNLSSINDGKEIIFINLSQIVDYIYKTQALNQPFVDLSLESPSNELKKRI